MPDAHQGTRQVLLGCSDGYVRVYWLSSYGEILLEPANRSTARDRAGPLYKYKWWHPLAVIEDKTNPDSASGSKLNQQLQKRTDRKRLKEHRGTGHRVSPVVTAMELTKTDLYVAYKSGTFEVPPPPSPCATAKVIGFRVLKDAQWRRNRLWRGRCSLLHACQHH